MIYDFVENDFTKNMFVSSIYMKAVFVFIQQIRKFACPPTFVLKFNHVLI